MGTQPVLPLRGRTRDGHVEMHPLCRTPVVVDGIESICTLLAGHVPNARTRHVPARPKPTGSTVRYPTAEGKARCDAEWNAKLPAT